MMMLQCILLFVMLPGTPLPSCHAPEAAAILMGSCFWCHEALCAVLYRQFGFSNQSKAHTYALLALPLKTTGTTCQSTDGKVLNRRLTDSQNRLYEQVY